MYTFNIYTEISATYTLNVYADVYTIYTLARPSVGVLDFNFFFTIIFSTHTKTHWVWDLRSGIASWVFEAGAGNFNCLTDMQIKWHGAATLRILKTFQCETNDPSVYLIKENVV